MSVPEIIWTALDWYEEDHDPEEDEAWENVPAEIAAAKEWLRRMEADSNRLFPERD